MDGHGTSSCLCRREPHQSRDAPVAAHNYLPGFIAAKPWQTITLTWSILPLSENSSKFCRSRAIVESGSGRKAHVFRQVSQPAGACHQMSLTSWLTQIRSENAPLSGYLLLKGTIFTRTMNNQKRQPLSPPKSDAVCLRPCTKAFSTVASE